MDVKQGISDAAVGVVSKAAYLASGSAVLIGGLTLHEWAAVTGILTATMTCCINWYYQRRRTLAAEKSNGSVHGHESVK